MKYLRKTISLFNLHLYFGSSRFRRRNELHHPARPAKLHGHRRAPLNP